VATWQSRLGQAVGLSVLAYVLFSFGWPALLIPLAIGPGVTDRAILPLIMGTPLYGTLFATLGIADGPHNMPGVSTDIWVGCCLWITIHGGLAELLYLVTRATFDRFL
jgi:hypothetical protein